MRVFNYYLTFLFGAGFFAALAMLILFIYFFLVGEYDSLGLQIFGFLMIIGCIAFLWMYTKEEFLRAVFSYNVIDEIGVHSKLLIPLYKNFLMTWNEIKDISIETVPLGYGQTMSTIYFCKIHLEIYNENLKQANIITKKMPKLSKYAIGQDVDMISMPCSKKLVNEVKKHIGSMKIRNLVKFMNSAR